MVVGGGLVTKAYLDRGMLDAIVGAIVTIQTAAHGLYMQRNAGMVALAAALPKFATIVLTREIAAQIDYPALTALMVGADKMAEL